MGYRYAASALLITGGVVWLAIQPGIALMGDITGEGDGGMLQGLAILVPSAMIGYWFAGRSTPAGIVFLAWSGLGIAFWTLYSLHHLGRWAADGDGNALLLIPEALLLLYVAAFVTGLFAALDDPESGRRPGRGRR